MADFLQDGRWLRHFRPTWSQESRIGRYATFKVMLSDLPTAPNAFKWAIRRINNGNISEHKLRKWTDPRLIVDVEKIFIRIERSIPGGYIIRVASKYTHTFRWLANLILYETNYQEINPQEISPRKFTPGRRSKKTGRIISYPTWTWATFSKRRLINVPYILTINPLDPSYDQDYGWRMSTN